ncbi:hypothetical protein H5410_003869 [Solanum commersonii]|uniref:Uncharacterized protein n=1 Tax=Solanum commersonii TaxID=4109 RepID=A0A9J6B677_SOLCO|nr:hypothetical protein H5410_003869 [Solanum commersonii]
MDLYLNDVNFIDKIPQSFTYLTSLRQLDMISCNLFGSIPRPLWNLTYIEDLLLDNNHLEGPISLFPFKKLIVLSLQNNIFAGLSFNGSWSPQLESFDISSNSLTGPIPSNVSGLKNLHVLYLSSNHLNGSIPSWIFDLPSLGWLDLSNNTFSGKIQEFTSKTLCYIFVQKNQMQECGCDDGVPQATTHFGFDQEEEGDSSIVNWQAVLMGYGCGLVIVLSVIYIMFATQYLSWFSRLFEELEHKIITRMQKQRKIN